MVDCHFSSAKVKRLFKLDLWGGGKQTSDVAMNFKSICNDISHNVIEPKEFVLIKTEISPTCSY